MNDIRKRITFIDIFKGIGIILMIMGHVGFGKSFDIYIHAFHMPMFFFISGFLYKYIDFTKLVKNKTKSLLIPYIEFGLFNLLMCLLLLPKFNIAQYFKMMFLFNNDGLKICGALWFLTCLFFVNLLFFLIVKAAGKFKQIGITLLITILVVILYFFKVKLLLSIDSAIYMLPVFYAGYLFKDFIQRFQNLNKSLQTVIGLALLFAFSFILFKNGYVNVRTNNYGNIIFFYINAIFLSIGLFYGAKLLECLKFSKIIEYIGKNSLNFMCLNQVVIIVLQKFHLSSIVIFLLTMVILVLANELMHYCEKCFMTLKS
ncbi:acyltransferase family protein [bacterium]|nr:acyltransferase family protein [bacterium]